jgi:hypothetical protein
MAAIVSGVAALAIVALQLRAFPVVVETTMGSGFGVPDSLPRFLEPAERAPSSDVTAGRWRAASGTRDFALRTPNPQPGTGNPEPRNPELGTRNPELGTRNPEPTVPAPVPVDNPSVIAARTFEGTYSAVAVPSVPERSQTNPWRFAGQAGHDVGTAARKAGVGVANSVTRASLSIARVF